MSIKDVAITYNVLGRNIEESRILDSIVSTSWTNRSNVTLIHSSNSNIRRSVVSVIIMRTDKESKHTSVVSCSVQILAVSSPMLMKLFLYYICFEPCKYSIAAHRSLSTFWKTAIVYVRCDFPGRSPCNSEDKRWFQKFVAGIRQVITSAQ